MSHWFEHTVVATGRLPLFFLLVAFVATFLFIRVSTRMIRAQVSWWPGNITPGGLHVHHVVFGLLAMLLSGFCFIALADFDTPVANCALAALFGIGSALVLDEFALVLHLRDVYWAEEGRTSIDAVFVAFAITVLFLLGIHPIGFVGEFDDIARGDDTETAIAVGVVLALQFALAALTLLKGKLWTGLLGLFFPPLLVVGAWRLARPRSPWARRRYTTRPAKLDRAVRREERYRRPIVRWKIVVQEFVSGRFGVPAEPAPLPFVPTEGERAPGLATRAANAIRWRRLKRRLEFVPLWRLPLVLVALAVVLGLLFVALDDSLGDDDPATAAVTGFDSGTTATLLSVIAGAMVTLTGLVFTAITLAMQFGASQISVRVVPMLQQEPIMRWSIGMFLATFVFASIIALDLAVDGAEAEPVVSTGLALGLTLVSSVLFVALVSRVGMILDSSKLLLWIAGQGASSLRRTFPVSASRAERPAVARTHDVPAIADGESTPIVLRRPAAEGRVLLAIDLRRIQWLARRWGVTVIVRVSIGDFVAQGATLFDVYGRSVRVRPHQLTSCLIFGDAGSPAASPTAALQAISDIALKALSPSINDPGRAVQAIDHLEDLLLEIAPVVRRDDSHVVLTRIAGYERTWGDYVSIATDEIRHFSGGSAQVQRRLRALLHTLIAATPAEQHPPLEARLAALDDQARREWHDPLDLRLAQATDPQGFGSQWGRTEPAPPLVVEPDDTGSAHPTDAERPVD
ncbi:DUF2254 domain-containing protein [Rhodococcus rhodnii]|uniref:Integral membrane protein n=2 Tax=Rhodococcus rhodnii TaxID=38312 RepID=R7WJ35_9NOCA|nr:DUF2254 family protein [Rhodococcus rhodnii]EOM75243.1 hypothetical protein Rrhod_3464 [Rhodococcus rhodnii LMG 5362]TXG89261.1 DUF2254 domain-containing protein [Rhodococcus rhodnii]